MAKKYASLTTLQNLANNIKALFVKKTDLETALLGYDTKGAAAAVQTNLNTVSDKLDAHTEDSDIHVTTSNKSNWNSAYTHSTSAHARVDATKVEDSTTNGNIKIDGTETNVYSHPNSGVSAGTYKSVTVNAQGHITGGTNPTTLAGFGITDGETKGTASSAVSTHNTSTSAHSDIRLSITELTTKLNNFLDVDDTTTDQLSELIALIQDNATDIESITNGKVNVSDIINNLTTNVTNKPLSAAQGVEIKRLIDALQHDIETIPQSDWNQNNNTQLDYIKNRPFYTTNPVETVIVDGTIPAGEYMMVSTNMQSLELDERYTVVFDGVTYDNLICEIIDGLPAIGSADFLFGIQSGRAMGLAKDNSISHTIKVIGYVTSIIPLERKYIAEYIDSFAGEKVEGKSYTINEESVTAAVGAEIFNDYETNIASGRYSHAEGKSNVASGMLSHAEGYEVEVSGGYSHGEGRNTIASGSESHAEGYHSRAKGEVSHAEGFGTEASGDHSHSEGDNAFAKGYASHAEGRGTEASGDHSHAEGWCTIASGENQHTQGKFNIEDTENKYAHIVGNGTSRSNLSNAHTIDWNGNGWFSGDVYVGGGSQNEGSKLISKADQRWNLLYDSGEISAIANSISNIDVSGYTNIQVLVRLYNDGDSINSRTGSAIFTAQNGKTYQFPVWSNMFSKSVNTVYTMATFNLVDGWLVCPYASRLIGDANTFEDVEGGTAGNLAFTGSGMMKCTSPLSTLTVSSLDQNSNYYFGMGSRVMVWGWNG